LRTRLLGHWLEDLFQGAGGAIVMAKSVKKKKAVRKIEKAVKRAIHKGIAEEDVEQAVDEAISRLPKAKIYPRIQKIEF
jgi:hypothetical protein